MPDEGFFHDAHEVFMTTKGTRTWVATFATKAGALGYVTLVTQALSRADLPTEDFEVVPV